MNLIHKAGFFACAAAMAVFAADARDVTDELQRAIDAAFLAGGGRVAAPAGTNELRGIRLRSNVALVLPDGCWLRASRQAEDYDIIRHDRLEPLPAAELTDALYEPPHARKSFDWINKAGSRWNNAIIRLYGATNAAIVAEGAAEIDGCNSFDIMGEFNLRGVHGVSAFACTNLVFSGFAFRRTGNWAFRLQDCAGLVFRQLQVYGGHDGVHVRSCDRVAIEDCRIETGDDAIAGYANRDVTVRRCKLNTACSAFRFGGTRVLIEDCEAWGPAVYPIRQSLPRELLVSGEGDGAGMGRRNMLSFFTYFCDRMRPLAEMPGGIVVRNCRVRNCDRFLHYNFSGNETWQLGSPLGDITFENVTAEGIGMSLCAYGNETRPTAIAITDSRFSFVPSAGEFMRAAALEHLTLENVRVEGLKRDSPLIRYWGEREPVVERRGEVAAPAASVRETAPFSTRPI